MVIPKTEIIIQLGRIKKYPQSAIPPINNPQINEVYKKFFFLLNRSTKVPAYKPKTITNNVMKAYEMENHELKPALVKYQGMASILIP